MIGQLGNWSEWADEGTPTGISSPAESTWLMYTLDPQAAGATATRVLFMGPTGRQ